MEWTQENRLGGVMTRSKCLNDRFDDLEWVQAYPTDRSKGLTTSPRRAPTYRRLVLDPRVNGVGFKRNFRSRV